MSRRFLRRRTSARRLPAAWVRVSGGWWIHRWCDTRDALASGDEVQTLADHAADCLNPYCNTCPDDEAQP